MNDECDSIKAIIDVWEREGNLDSASLSHLDAHLESCGECRARYRLLLPFIHVNYSEDLSESVKTDFTDRVMDRIQGESPKKSGSHVFTYLATAAAAIIVVGALLLFTIGPLGETPSDTAISATESSTEYIQIHFKLTAPQAESVALVGDFTGWEMSKIQLTDPDKDGVWEAEVKLKKDNVYLYNFVIDGEEWVVDPESIMKIEDGFGGESSILTL